MQMNDREKLRLDALLAERGLAPTRSRARDVIKRGLVAVNGEIETRPGIALTVDTKITVSEDWSGYVSRGALKLLAALDHFGLMRGGRGAGHRRIDRRFHAGAAATRSKTGLRGRCRKGTAPPGHLSDPRVVNMENMDAGALRRAARSAGQRHHRRCQLHFADKGIARRAVASLAGRLARRAGKAAIRSWAASIGKGGIVRGEAAREAALGNVVASIRGEAGKSWAPCLRRSRASREIASICSAPSMRRELTISRLGTQGDGIAIRRTGPPMFRSRFPVSASSRASAGRGQLIDSWIRRNASRRSAPISGCAAAARSSIRRESHPAWKRQRVVDALSMEGIETPAVSRCAPSARIPVAARPSLLRNPPGPLRSATAGPKAMTRRSANCPVLLQKLEAAIPILREVLDALLSSGGARVL